MRFLYMDRVLDLVKGERILARKTVALDADYLERHFPRRAVVPGALVLEYMAQAGGWLNFVTHDETIRMVVAVVEGATLHREVRPGDTLDVEMTVTFLHPGGVTMSGECRVGPERVATVERMVFANDGVPEGGFTPDEEAHFRYMKACVGLPGGDGPIPPDGRRRAAAVRGDGGRA